MIDHRALFEERIGRLLHWEQVKRRERLLVSALVYSILVSLATLPMGDLFPPWAGPVTITPVLFVILASLFFLSRPWGVRDSLDIVLRLDRSLRLQERVLTAWEIIRRGVRQPAEWSVIESADTDLQSVNVEGLFKRDLSWQFYLTLPLLFLWLWIAWFGIEFIFRRGLETKATAVAKELKDYTENLRTRAEGDQLVETLKAADSLEELADRGLNKEVGEVGMRESLREAIQGMRAVALGAMEEPGSSLPGMSRGALRDLKSELVQLQDSLNRFDSSLGKGILNSDVLERLDRLAPYRGAPEKQSPKTRDLNKQEALKFLEQLDAKRRAEEDRRAFMEAQAFLTRLLDSMEGDTRRPLETREPSEGSSSTTQDDSQKGSLPGNRPGTLGPKVQFPQFKAQAETHLKGLVKGGMGAGITVRGELAAKENRVAEEQVVTQYRRQVEGELASEEIPHELKETVKSYFLSLGMMGEGDRGRR